MKCSICNEEIIGYGNNPYPIRADKNARCCDKCNAKYVLYFRIGLIGARKELVENATTILNDFTTTDLDRLMLMNGK